MCAVYRESAKVLRTKIFYSIRGDFNKFVFYCASCTRIFLLTLAEFRTYIYFILSIKCIYLFSYKKKKSKTNFAQANFQLLMTMK